LIISIDIATRPTDSSDRKMKIRSSHFSPRSGQGAFTLVELLTVLAISVLLVSLAAPALGGLSKSNDVDASANRIAGAINEARAYAIANSTYTWVGFYEENATLNSTTPASPGTGRVVIDLVAAADSTLPYSTSTTSSTPISSNLIQLAPLMRLSNTHLVTFPVTVAGNSIVSPGAVAISNESISSIGSSTPSAASLTPFNYPLSGAAQYVFTKAIQFSPRGEARINNSTSTYPLESAIEIGLQPTRGALVDPISVNLVSVQITGVSGDTIVYRK